MVMNAKKFQRPSDGHGDRASLEKPVRMGVTSAGDGRHSLSRKLKPGKKPPGVNGNGCRRGDLDGRRQSEIPLSDKKKKGNEITSQKKKAEVQRTALRVCGEWSEHVSSSGKAYYYNCRTEVSRWEKPDGWTDTSEEKSCRSKEAKKKLMTKKNNSHSAHDPNVFQDNSTSGFPSPTFSLPSFPSPTSQGAFHPRTPQVQFAPTTFPFDDMAHRNFQAVGNFPAAGNFPVRTNCVRNPVRPWLGPSGYYCDSPVVDCSGRGQLWSPLSADIPVCLGRGVELNDGAMYEDMDISPEGSPIIIDDRPSRDDGWTDGRRFASEVSESRPATCSLLPGLFSPANSVPLSADGALKVTVANALTALWDSLRRTVRGSALMDSERFSGLASSDFGRSLGLTLDAVSQIADELNNLADQPAVHQAVEMLQKLDTRAVAPQHQTQLQQLIARLVRIQNASQNHSTVSPDSHRTVTCTGTMESSSAEAVETGRRSSVQVETAPLVVSHSCDNDSQKPQGLLGDSNGEKSTVASNVPCPGGAPCTMPTPLMALSPALANYVDNRLIQHVMEWPAQSIERQAKSAADLTHLMYDLQWTRVSVDLKNLRSLIRTNEILATLTEQKALFLAQQVEDLEQGHAKFVTSYDDF